MTPFEEGYAAYLRRDLRQMNKFDKEKSPRSHVRWDAGWVRAYNDHMPK